MVGVGGQVYEHILERRLERMHALHGDAAALEEGMNLPLEAGALECEVKRLAEHRRAPHPRRSSEQVHRLAWRVGIDRDGPAAQLALQLRRRVERRELPLVEQR